MTKQYVFILVGSRQSIEYRTGESIETDIENGQLTGISAMDNASHDYISANAINANGGSDRLVEIQSEDPTEAQALLEAFKKEIEAIGRAIDKIEENVNEIDAKYKQSQGRHISYIEKTELNGQISTLVAQTTKTSQAVRKRLGRIADENAQFAREYPDNGASLKIRVTTHQVVTQRFMNVMQRLEEIQERHHESVRLVIENQLRKFNPDANEQDIENVLKQCDNDNRDNHDMMDNSPLLCQLPQEEQDKLREQLNVLSERNRNIRQLEQDVIDLHQMFADMKLLVDQQGELLNTIEYNVQETKGRAEAGMHEIIQAHDFQRKANHKKWCIFFLIAAIIATVCIFVFVRYGRKWFGVDIGPAAADDAGGASSGATGGGDGPAPQAPTATEVPASSGRSANVTTIATVQPVSVAENVNVKMK